MRIYTFRSKTLLRRIALHGTSSLMATAEYHRKYRAKRKLMREQAAIQAQTTPTMPEAPFNSKGQGVGIGLNARCKRSSIDSDKGAITPDSVSRGPVASRLSGSSAEVSGEISGVSGDVSLLKPPVHARVRDPKTGRFPGRVPTCSPCAPDQYALALVMMRDGQTTAAIQVSTGAMWQTIQEYGLVNQPEVWPELVNEWRQSRASRIIDKAQAVALQEDHAEISETSGPTGVTRSERKKSDPAMMAQALAGLMPEIHGKLASKSVTAVQVNIGLNELIAEVEKRESDGNT